MMRYTITLLLTLFLTNLTFAQTDKEAVTAACMGYIEGFYEGDTAKLIANIKPTLHKFGFWKNDESGEYEHAGQMTFDEAKAYARRVLEKQRFAKPGDPKGVEVLDIMPHIAAAKVTASWGVDYVLLSKAEGKWMIEQVIWQGPPLKK